MADTLLPLKLPPGMRNTGTVYQSKGRWHKGNLIRFFNDTIRPIGGWALRSLTGATISGVPRAMVSYRRNDNTNVLVIGTTRGLYAIVSTTVYDITPSEVISNNAARLWQLDVFGAYLVAVDLIAPSTTGAMYYWTGDTATTGELVSPWSGSNPTLGLSVVTTPERFLVMLGGKHTAAGWSATGVESQFRLVTWATQEGGFTGSDWVPAAANTAGDFTLTTDGSLVCGRRSRGTTLLWTTTDLWTMTYIGGTFVYRFDQAGNKCGIIAPNAVAVNDTGAYWMGENGFYGFDGFAKPIPCEVHDYVFDSLNRTYAHLIWALENPHFGEVTWWYPSEDATEIDRYVTFNYRENHWTTGTLSRTCGIASQPGVTNYPVMTTSAAAVYNHESGTDRGTEDPAYLESGPVELGEGDRLMHVSRMIADDRTEGDVSVTLKFALHPDDTETTSGPHDVTANTSLRVTGRQVRVRLDEVTDIPPIASLSSAEWTARATPTDTAWCSVAWSESLGLAVAVSYDGIASPVITSPDGVTWTARAAGAVDNFWNDVIWVEELGMFVAVSDASGTATNVMTSTNGTAWTLRTAPDNGWIAVAWNGTKLVAVSYNNTDNVMSSTDGITWALETTTGFLPGGAQDIAWSSTLGLFVAVDTAASAPEQIATSPTGVAWTARTGSALRYPRRVLWSDALAMFIATADEIGGAGGASIFTSTDGITWSLTSLGVAALITPQVLAFAEDKSRLLILDDNITTMAMSADAVTFTSATIPAVDWYDAVYATALGMFIGVNIAGSGTDGVYTYGGVARDWRIGTLRLGVIPAGRR